MPTLLNRQNTRVVKMLLVGNSGTGKTAALAALANAGYRLLIADFDNGLDILSHLVEPQAQPNVIFETFTDKLRNGTTGPMLIGNSEYARFIQCLSTGWSVDNTKVQLESLGPKDVFVIDSLTMLGEAAMRYVLLMNKRNGMQPWQSDWGTAIRLQEGLLAQLYDASIKCNVIVIAHLKSISEGKNDKGETSRSETLFPSALGNQLPPKVGSYFNAMLHLRIAGSQRIFSTIPVDNVDVKTALPPGSIPSTLPLKDGLLTFFKAYVSA